MPAWRWLRIELLLKEAKMRIAVAIPCHRVVGSGGALVGYAGGLEAKAYLLGLERETEG